MKDPKHPLWSILRLFILMTSLTLILYMNAQHFDETELRSITWVFVIAAGAEGGMQFATRFTNKPPEG